MKSLVRKPIEKTQASNYNQEKLKLLISSSCSLCDRMIELYDEVKNDLPYHKLVEVVNIEQERDFSLQGLTVSSVPFLLVNSKKGLTKDAKKRLDAISCMEDLGAGFTLATHDMEIRGAGELLGDEQSGQMQEIGFGLYNELLERAQAYKRIGQVSFLNRIESKWYRPDIEELIKHYKNL